MKKYRYVRVMRKKSVGKCVITSVVSFVFSKMVDGDEITNNKKTFVQSV